ncbi:MAG: response regulator transcription factor [Chitinophagales bacterium]|nr:response regulator transcription factor [Chitinophagales bacterium]
MEDDLSFALELGILIKKIGCSVIRPVDHSAEALELIYSESPDLILMDINIKGRMNGVEIGQKIRHLEIPILYITSFDDEVIYQEAKKSRMIGYLVKPVSKYSLTTAINLAISNAKMMSQTEEKNQAKTGDFVFRETLFFKKKNIYHKVQLSEIVYVEADDKYCLTHTVTNEKFVARIAISKMERNLPREQFFRIHRSYLVGLNKISSVNFFEGTLRVGEKELPISRANRKLLQELMTRME